MLLALLLMSAAQVETPAKTTDEPSANPAAAAPTQPGAAAPMQPGAAAPTQPADALADLSPEERQEIADDSARDLRESRFYNRPGATRADYDAEWQECRLIARGSRSMGGQVVTVPYNPGIISPAAASGAGLIGAMIGNAIVEGQLRRANRRACLLVKGWSLAEVEEAAARARIAEMSDAEREAHFNRLVGAETLPAGLKILRWENHFAAPKLAASIGPRDAAKDKAAQRKPVKPVDIASGQGGVILAFRRPDEASQGKSASLLISRYDPEAANIVVPARRDKADTTTYSVLIKSRDKTLEVEHVLHALTPGSYVLSGATPGVQGVVNMNFCLSSVMFTVEAGKITYIGDFVPYPLVEVESGGRVPAMAWRDHFADAEAAAPALQSSAPLPVQPASFTNGVSWGCAATVMAAYSVPGAPSLEGPRRAGPPLAPPVRPTTVIAIPTN